MSRQLFLPFPGVVLNFIDVVGECGDRVKPASPAVGPLFSLPLVLFKATDRSVHRHRKIKQYKLDVIKEVSEALFIQPKQPATGTEAPKTSDPTGTAGHPADLMAATQDLPQPLPDESDDCCDRRRTEARYVHAYTLLKDGQKRKEILGEDHPVTLRSMGNLSETYQLQGKVSEAATLQEQVLLKRRSILGEDHMDTLWSMGLLAVIYQQQGRLTEANELNQETLRKRKEILGEEHPHVLLSLENIANMYQQQGRLSEAAKLIEEVLMKRRVISGEEHMDTLRSMESLVAIYQQQGRISDAAKMNEEVLLKRRVISGEEHPDTLQNTDSLAGRYQQERISEVAEQ